MFGALPGLVTNIPELPRNPTDSQRHTMLYNSLKRAERPEDYSNIISLLSPPDEITTYGTPGSKKHIKVGIVGGGLAGMAAAFELRKLGFDITIFEAREDRIGGRVYTYYFDKDKRLFGEFGAMRFPVSHETTWHYINLFKLNTEAFIQSSPSNFIYVRDLRIRNGIGGRNVQYHVYPEFDLTAQERNTPWPRLFTQVSDYYLSTLPPKVRAELLMILNRYDYRLEDLMRFSTRQALQQYGLSGSAIDMIISIMPLVGSVIYNSYETNLLDDYSMDYVNLYTISGGMSYLPFAFYKSLTSPNPVEYGDLPQEALGKVGLRTGQLITGLFRSGTNGKVTLSYNILPSTEEVYETFDYVILAAPLASLRALALHPLFSQRKMQAIKDVVYQDAQKTLFLCNERFWEKQGIMGGISFTDRVIASIRYPHDHFYCTPNKEDCSPDQPGVLLASYNISQDALRLGNEREETRFEFIKRDVEAVHGLPRGYLDNVVTEYKTIDWYREQWFFGAFQMYLPGQREDFLYITSTPEYNNRVFFAGEHASPKNAWMQGALQSGMIAANDLAYYAGIHGK